MADKRATAGKPKYPRTWAIPVARIESAGRPVTPGDVWNAVTRAGVDPARLALSLSHVLGEVIECDAVIVTPGTFMNGLMHVGDRTIAGGRVGEAPSRGTKPGRPRDNRLANASFDVLT